MTKPTHGGARKDSGRKSEYGEPTENLTVRVPKSKKPEILEQVRAILERYKVD